MNAIILSYRRPARHFRHIVSRLQLFCFTMLACAWIYGPADAATITFNDGGTHIFDYAADNVAVSNSTTVDVQAGAQTTPGIGAYGIGLPGINSSGNSTVNVNGGTLSGGDVASGYPTYYDGGAGVSSLGGSVTLSDGLLEGGTGTRAGDGLAAYGALVTISGGTAVGGNGSDYYGGSGVELDRYSGMSASMTMTGGTVLGGDGWHSGKGIYAQYATINIAGGSVSSGTSPFSSRGYAIWADYSQLTITGGLFNGEFRIGSNSTIDVWGTDLTYNSDRPYNGILSGYLQDNSPINVYLSLGGCGTVLNINGQLVTGEPPENCPVNTGPVPLPGAIWLLASGLPLLLAGNLTRLIKRRRG